MEEDNTFYELWEGYHRVTVMRKLGSEGWTFPVVNFIVAKTNCDMDKLYKYCFGILFFFNVFALLILF